jgi:uncharacterized phage protein gp47/JayE
LPFSIPSLGQCVERTRASFRSYLPGTDGWLWPNNIGPTAKVIGGSAWELHNRLGYVQQAMFALTAVGADLDAHGSQINLARKQAAPAAGDVVVTTADVISIAIGAQFQRLDGIVFTAAAAAGASAAGTFSVPVVAALAGSAANSQAGTAFAIISGASGNGAATATAAADSNGLSGGLDVEADGAPYTSDLSTYRGRILFRKRNPVQGGAPADYVTWAGSVAGVTRTFVERGFAGPGTVRIFPLFDQAFAAAGGIPSSPYVALVAAAIDALAPADAVVVVAAPTAQPIAVTVQGLTPNTAAVQQAVIAELADTFRRVGAVSGIDNASAALLAALPFLAVPFTFSALWASQAVANAAGDARAVMIAPLADITIAAASLPVLGTVTFE